MSNLTITTNNVPRFTIYGSELTTAEAEEFDYLKGEELDCSTFFRYKGSVHYLGDFMAIRTHAVQCREPLAGWDGYRSDSFFDGLVVRYIDDSCEEIVVGHYCS